MQVEEDGKVVGAGGRHGGKWLVWLWDWGVAGCLLFGNGKKGRQLRRRGLRHLQREPGV
jgi:hypothetical protein